MGGHDHGPPYEIPHHSCFSQRGIPELEALEKALCLKGLRDPWIRNDAWRYHPGFGTKWQRANKTFFRGLPLGFALALVTVGLTTVFGGSDDCHGHCEH